MREALTTLALGLLVALFSATSLTSADESRLALPGVGHLAGADVTPDGWTLVAWKDADNHWSKVAIHKDGRQMASWDFPQLLVKNARWAEPGKRFVLDSVGGEGVETRVYSVADGALDLEWSTRPLEARFLYISMSKGAELWLGSRFEVESAEVALGRVGESDPFWTWHLDAKALGTPSRAQVDDYSYPFFLQGSGNPPDIGILWGARLWLARPMESHLVRMESPDACPQVNSATSTASGIWIECYRGIEAEYSNSWALYPDGYSFDVTTREPALVEQFRSPKFLPDGTVLDQYTREGRAELFRLPSSGAELEHLGTISHPEGARVLIGGDALLIEDVRSTDEYRILSLEKEITALRSAKPER